MRCRQAGALAELRAVLRLLRYRSEVRSTQATSSQRVSCMDSATFTCKSSITQLCQAANERMDITPAAHKGCGPVPQGLLPETSQETKLLSRAIPIARR